MVLGMNTRTVVMVGVALLAAGGTALFARGWINAQRATLGSHPEPGVEVLVAKVDLPPGHFVNPQDLRWQVWPKGTLAPAYVVKGKRKPEEFDGAVSKSRLVAGQPVTDAQVVRPGEQGFLAAVLEPGKRAVSIQVNAITGISGFVFPGDRVDMVLTHTVAGRDGRAARHVSETVLEDIRVLAVDQKIDGEKGKASVAKTVTFEVTPKQVEKIGIISRLGKIALSLRPIAREPAPEQPSEKPNTQAGAQASTGAAPPPVPGARTASFSPISAARAAELPVPLIHAGDEMQDAAAPAEDASTVEASAAEKGAGLVPRGERAGITLDTEVSRVIGRNRPDSGPKVSIVRGAKIEERRF